jgi:hypothetical protein
VARRLVLALGFFAAGLAFPTRAQQSSPEVVARALSGTEAGTILGEDVFDLAGDNVGQLVDVLVDKNGNPVAGVVDVGGFLGVGTRRVAIAWRLLHFVHDNDGMHVVMDLTFQSAAAAPEFEGPDHSLIVIDRPPP